MLLLIVAVYACILLRENYPRGSDIREGLKTWHFMLGLSVFALVGVRATLRALTWKIPGITPEPPRYLAWMGAAAHLAIYLWLIAMPVAGWAILSGEGETIPFWGLALPPLPGIGEDLSKQIKELHELGGTIGYFLLGLHAAAAVFHHYILKDDTMFRMLPPRR
jgi:cytochrome b561